MVKKADISQGSSLCNFALPKKIEAVAYKETISDEELHEMNELLFVRELERMA